MSSYRLLVNVSSHVSQFKPFRRMSKASREAFARDISLIGLSVRTGYLVDTIYIPDQLAEETYSTLLDGLRELSDYFNDTLHLYEPGSNQSFIVNKTLLVERLGSILKHQTSDSHLRLVSLPEKGEPYRLDTIPLPLLHLLQAILNELTHTPTASKVPGKPPTTLKLPSNLAPTLCIPLAAILLDYPVAYVPSGDQVSFLSDVPLVLYKCWVKGYPQTNSEKNHLLLQFSCPASLMDVSSTSIISHLKSMFEPRVLQCLPGSTFQVDYELVTLDRVAL